MHSNVRDFNTNNINGFLTHHHFPIIDQKYTYTVTLNMIILLSKFIFRLKSNE